MDKEKAFFDWYEKISNIGYAVNLRIAFEAGFDSATKELEK